MPLAVDEDHRDSARTAVQVTEKEEEVTAERERGLFGREKDIFYRA